MRKLEDSKCSLEKKKALFIFNNVNPHIYRLTAAYILTYTVKYGI